MQFAIIADSLHERDPTGRHNVWDEAYVSGLGRIIVRARESVAHIQSGTIAYILDDEAALVGAGDDIADRTIHFQNRIRTVS